jgi:predicted NAD-dependent protein-ADP-ribosyltransferase YbiA (DUF1768 family)
LAATSLIHDEEISLRFIDLSETVAAKFVRMLPKSWTIEKRRWRKTENVLLAIELSRNLDVERLSDAIRQSRIPRRKFGIWISLVTESDHDGVTVPIWICDLHQRIGGKIDFSVTLV